ncbi:MAG: hypothetical protein ACKVQW_09355 [Pyrinomonadaceae bacterium]
MTYKGIKTMGATVIKNKILFIVFMMIVGLLLTTTNLRAQTPSPTPSDSSATMWGYDVTSSIELGARGLGFSGSDEKFRSDLNYRPGFRVFDSSFRMETNRGKGKPFDSLTVTTSGWSADPSGFVRVNAAKSGAYNFSANVRRVNLINRVNNLILGLHPSDTLRYFGDFDVTIFPESEKLRLRFGTSFYNARGDRGASHRTRDVFPITERLRSNTTDIRAGVDTQLAGFNLSFTGGIREFIDRGKFVVTSRQVGVAGNCYFGICISPTDVNFLNRLERENPTDGDTKYGMFSMQRTFAKRLDLTGRFIYSVTDRTFNITDNINYDGQVRYTNAAGSGVTSPNLFVDADTYEIGGRSNRPQSRGDIGVTYAATDSFRISNTFTFDQYNSFGDSNYFQKFMARCQIVSGSTCPVAGGPFVAGLAGVSFLDTRTLYWYSYGFKRFTNTIEGDYQFNNKVGVNIGYRYTHRKVSIAHVNRTVDDFVNRPITAAFTSADDEEEENTAHILLFGAKIKPTTSWAIFVDGERGEADNSFIRLANNDYTNFRVRSNWNYKQFTFSVSGIIRNNENPSRTADYRNSSGAIILPAFDIIANVRNRVFSAYVDYVPDPRWTLSSGYTYSYLSSKTDLVVPLSISATGPPPSTTPNLGFLRGFSEFYMKDNYFFFDVTANPVNRLSFFASYRYNKDNGQGTRVSALAERIISSYPFQSHVPEFRVAIKLTNNIDWNLGYQYNSYKENLRIGYYQYNELANTNVIPATTVYPPNQNYRAHLPYTSLRIYFGRGAGGR